MMKGLTTFFFKAFSFLFLRRSIGKVTYQPIFEKLFSYSRIGMGFGQGGNLAMSGEIKALKYVKKRLAAKDSIVLFDVGANQGNYTRLLLREFSTANLSIHSFEPSPDTFVHLSNQIHVPEVALHSVGLSDFTENSPIFIHSANTKLSSLYNRRLNHYNIEMDTTEEVELVTLDEFCIENNISHIDFLKMDVEGHELNVLRGSKRMLEQRAIQFIQFEFGGSNIDSRTYFQDFWYKLYQDYKIFRVLPGGLYEIHQYHESLEIFQTTNYLAELK